MEGYLPNDVIILVVCAAVLAAVLSARWLYKELCCWWLTNIWMRRVKEAFDDGSYLIVSSGAVMHESKCSADTALRVANRLRQYNKELLEEKAQSNNEGESLK